MEISQLSRYSHFLKSIDVAKAFEIFAVILFYDEILLVCYISNNRNKIYDTINNNG